MSVRPINPEILLLDSDEDEREQSPHPWKIQRGSSKDIHNQYNNNNNNNNNHVSVLLHTSSSSLSPSVEAKLSPKNDSEYRFEEAENQNHILPSSSPSPSVSSSIDHSHEDSELEEMSFRDVHASDSPSTDSNSNSVVLEDEHITKELTSLARYYLKVNGSMKFLDKYLPVTLNSDHLFNLIRLLGYRPKLFKIESEEEKLMFLIKYLQRAMNKVLMMRVRLQDFNKIDDFLSRLESASKIMVLTGAGISTSLGIPDFRSAKGFYARLPDLGLDDPQEVFDLEYFKEDPTVFYSIAHMIVPPENAYTPLHGFIKLLQDKGKLLRNYTQNIDNLESNVGILKEKLIQCHGSFATLSCITCGFQVPGDTIFKEIKLQQLPICPWCKLKRDKLDEEIQGSYGVMKPDITFFGELLPERFHHTIKHDIEDCDLLICIGTSLKVAPVSNIVNLIPAEVPQILINKDLVGHCEFDLSLLGYCDQVITYICDKLGWEINHKDIKNILESELECESVEPDIGIYEISTKDQRDEKIDNTVA